ncbi:MAG: amidohydrolase [Clostridia bacterium]|nr:amidohydrolase [Clostridia bacterium]
MTGYPVWDSHVHLFPEEVYRNWDKYAARDQWFKTLTKKPADGRGTEEVWANIPEALAAADQAGVHGLAMQGWYWNDAGLMIMHNDYMCDAFREHPGRLVGFASINPKFGERAIAEIERCAKLGFSGIGELGPGGNGYDFNDPDFLAVLECAQFFRLPVCIHCGEPVGHVYPGKDTTSLAPLPGVAERFPDLRLILAHLGGGLPFYAMNPKLAHSLRNVYYDTAANPLLYGIRSIRAVIEMVGAEQLLYGSDFPLLLYPSRSREMDFSLFLSDIREHAGLSAKESALFFSDNFRNLLSIQ